MTKKLWSVSVALCFLFCAGNAFAEVDSLSLRFGGGCNSTNKRNCVLKADASGTELDSDTVVFETAPNSHGRFRLLSTRPRPLSSTGHVTATFRNIPVKGTCYRATTGENGNDNPDVISNTICVK